jgi:hypothetical protein
MLTFLILAGILAVGVAAMRIAGPEYYSPKCCMGIAYRIVSDHNRRPPADVVPADGSRPACPLSEGKISEMVGPALPGVKRESSP